MTNMDPECLPLVKILNRLSGIETIESCCGHGGKPFLIWLTAEQVADLLPIAWALDSCHSGCKGWQLIAHTDCAADLMRFRIKGPTGSQAYKDACAIAALIKETELSTA